jgi:hypothetical protein
VNFNKFLGRRESKFEALLKLQIEGDVWTPAPSGWRDPFLPQSTGAWSTYPSLENFFVYNGAGVMPGRTWIISPDQQSLLGRWDRLKSVPPEQMDDLFTPHMGGDRHVAKENVDALHGFPIRLSSVMDDQEACILPIRYGFRTLDRQWIIPDKRLINRPNPELWKTRSDSQLYLTAFQEESPTTGPAVTASGLIPDLHHYKGSFGGRVFPLWSNAAATVPNLKPALLALLQQVLGQPVVPEDLFSYIAALAASPAYTARFQPDLSTPGLRIPLTSEPSLFNEAALLGRRVLWLHTFGERFANTAAGRPPGPPRADTGQPTIPLAGRISGKPEDFPDTLNYDAGKHRLLVGHGYIENVSPAVWAYEVSGKHVLTQWFSYRRKNRERPVMGDRRPPSKLNNIQPDHWLPEYTTELLNVLNVLSLLVEIEPAQADLLHRICAGPLLSNDTLTAAGALAAPPKTEKLKKTKSNEPQLF